MTHRTRSLTEAPDGLEPQPDGVRDGLTLDRWADMLGIGSKAVLTTVEAASILRISEKSVRGGIQHGSIPYLRLGRRILIPVPMLLSSLLVGAPNDQMGV